MRDEILWLWLKFAGAWQIRFVATKRAASSLAVAFRYSWICCVSVWYVCTYHDGRFRFIPFSGVCVCVCGCVRACVSIPSSVFTLFVTYYEHTTRNYRALRRSRKWSPMMYMYTICSIYVVSLNETHTHKNRVTRVQRQRDREQISAFGAWGVFHS